MSDLVSIVASSALVVLVAVLLRNLLGGSPLPSGATESSSEAAIRDLAAVLQSRDLTVPRTQDLAVMVLYLPDYSRMIRERPLEQVFHAVNVFYRVATEISDQHKGEVASLVGGEICVLFGRILPVEQPLPTAVIAALEIIARVQADLPPEIAAACRGAAAAITFGPALSGPVGGEWRRTYASVGVPVEDAQALVRTTPAGEVRVRDTLTSQLEMFVLELAPGDSAARRITAARPAPDAPPAPPPA